MNAKILKHLLLTGWLLTALGLIAGCGGGGGGPRIDGGGNNFVQDNQNTTFNRQVKVTPDGSTVLVAQEFLKYSGSAELQSVLAVMTPEGRFLREIRVPRNIWAVAVADNNTAYVAADNGMVAKVSLTNGLINFATGMGGLRDIIVNPAGNTLYACNERGDLHIIHDIQTVTEATEFAAKKTVKVSGANFIGLRYDAFNNRVMVLDYTGRLFLLDTVTDDWVTQASPSTPVSLLTQATPESPLLYQVSQIPNKTFAAFDPILTVNSIKVGTAAASPLGTTVKLDHDNNAATPEQEFAWKVDTGSGNVTFYNGTATTSGKEITSPMVDKEKTVKATDIKVDLTLAERFYVGTKFRPIGAEIVRAGGTDWLLFLGENINQGTGPIDEPGALDRDNQFQVYKLAAEGAGFPLSLLASCNPAVCRQIDSQSPRAMKAVMSTDGGSVLVAIGSYESNSLSFVRYRLDADNGNFAGPDQDGNGADIQVALTGGRGLWDLSFSTDRRTVYTSNLLSQDMRPIPVPATLVQGFVPGP